jgi:hypothetical protein
MDMVLTINYNIWCFLIVYELIGLLNFVIFVKNNIMKYINIKAASGVSVIIFIDKITHIYTTSENRTMIKLINENILTNLSIPEVLNLINKA